MMFPKSYLLFCLVSVFVVATGYAADSESADSESSVVESSALSIATADVSDDFNNIRQTPREHWYRLSLMGTKIGYTHTSFEKSDYLGETLLRIRMEMVMNLKALGTDLTLELTRVEYTGSDLMPRYFLSASNESGSKKVEGRIVDGVASITTTLNRETTLSEVSVPQDTISSLIGVNLLLAQKRLGIGDKRTFHLFNYDLLRPVRTEIHVVSEETLIYQSKKEQVYVVDQTLDIMEDMTTRMWISSDGGTIYRMETQLNGVSMRTTKTDKATALGEAGDIDVISRTRVLHTGKRPVPNSERLVADLKLTTGNIADIIFSNSRQKLEVFSERTGRISIQVPTVEAENCPNLRMVDVTTSAGRDLPDKKKESEFLTPTAYIQADHPEIHAKAIEILDGEMNSWRAAEKLCWWVYEAITDKGSLNGYASSLTILETLKGDCTEHTILFIALARSVGIPSRICSGVVSLGDGFYGHFWPEVYVGKWVQMDPTLRQIIADANHIQISGGVLESDTLVEFAVSVFRALNELEIVVIE